MNGLRAKSRQAGFTLIELLVAIALGGVVLGSTVGAMSAQGRSAALQQGFADAQLTSRGIAELFQQDLRMSGYGMLGVSPDQDVVPLEYAQLGTKKTVTLRGAYANIQTTLKQGAIAGSMNIVVDTPAAGSFATGEMILIDSGMNSEIRNITATTTISGDLTISLDAPLQYQYPVGPNVTQLEVVIWELEGKMLRRNGAVIADNVGSLDLQYIDHLGDIADQPGDNLRSVMIDLRTAQPTTLPGSPEASSRLMTEVNVRNLAFRFTLG
ncbi:MAG: prepilin-type N-terminal cleavage/methylation domain-containing protein [Deltaproteobacteria bacterium]